MLLRCSGSIEGGKHVVDPREVKFGSQVEIGVIVISVLIALAGEQTVEAVHWHGDVADAKGALRVELDHDLGARSLFPVHNLAS